MKGGPRILGGRLRGRRLPSPPEAVRPTEGRVREALFAIWQERVPEAALLDLFAGSGAVAIEAISRGAAWVTLVEVGGREVARLRRLCRALAPEKSEVWRARLPGFLRRPPPRRYDLIFADPPYRFRHHATLVEAAAGWLAPQGELAIEHDARAELPPVLGGCRRRDRRTWGEIHVSFYRLG
ncbi:MAG: 16S rRNA (guanine(966)-N(2))-methyltransferase RsmD [Acidobacteria bacterium]|nr:MAG: 16S rRNA (guanine(966)-N(2))-methyltransferase RsmD [Acidobacteriota bacterium]